MKRQKELESSLPHIYGSKFYPWQREFHDSSKRVNLICSANQIGKSSIAIRRVIRNATDVEAQKRLYKRKPLMFWYFYPDSQTLDREWTTKWEAEWLPRGAMKDHPIYGWKERKDKGVVSQVKFNSGVTLYFLFYTKNVSAMQAGTVDDITVDEELPMELYSELTLRLAAVSGIFNMVCTPTLNQIFWKKAIETADVLPMALKLNVSMYDCLLYEDGTPSTVWTREKIREVELKCESDTEVLRRVHGKFVTEEGRKFFAFDPVRNMCPPVGLAGYHVYAAVDYGSGGSGGHPAAIGFVAVSADYRKGYLFRAWRGDKIQTTAGDVLDKYVALSKDINVVQAWYDPASKDFGVLADRSSVNFAKADKSRDAGEKIVNTLFKHRMLMLFEGDPEIDKASEELMSIMNGSTVGKSGDDLADMLRYLVIGIPWDFTGIEESKGDDEEGEQRVPKILTEAQLLEMQINDRRGIFGKRETPENGSWAEIEAEFAEWNEAYGN